jgi:hypothetical protein
MEANYNQDVTSCILFNKNSNNYNGLKKNPFPSKRRKEVFMRHVIALFGEAEKGQFSTPYLFQKLPQLVDSLGNPPIESKGLFFAIQALLYEREIIYFRVQTEGFSKEDYMIGFKQLQNSEKIKKISALCLPGVGDAEILSAADAPCAIHKSSLIMTEQDLYDYLTSG